MSSFTYKSLPDGGNFTRMVQLLPNVNSDAPVECHLLDYDLGSTEYQPHVYEALSYCWGSQNKPESAILNGLTLPITTNLKAALQHLRDSQLPRTVWIDAICINQDDNKEKGKQIPLMRRIYAQASQVIVWLGDCTDAGDKALEELRDPAMIWTGYSEITSKLLQRDWFQRIWVSFI
ncbi:heterokaryon incompatibility protein-domain-containing protein [Penicillium angulare]|uniref:Heterokaryon incompatibility protein-domain-containing protein n=1 Tax=Penicillium angulare TaxID=116970 RepID=A0A9W9KSU2_9EURO|nr:heterokaryon incompatibility protein-domain-containing protein [Penicillium angulare]